MSKPISGPDSSFESVLYELDVRGLALLQPCTARKINGSLWIIVMLQEKVSSRTFVGEGPYIHDAVNAAFEKAETQGLRNSRLS